MFDTIDTNRSVNYSALALSYNNGFFANTSSRDILYHVTANITWQSFSAGASSLFLKTSHPSTPALRYASAFMQGGSNPSGLMLSTLLLLKSQETFSIYAYQTTLATRTIVPATDDIYWGSSGCSIMIALM